MGDKRGANPVNRGWAPLQSPRTARGTCGNLRKQCTSMRHAGVFLIHVGILDLSGGSTLHIIYIFAASSYLIRQFVSVHISA